MTAPFNLQPHMVCYAGDTTLIVHAVLANVTIGFAYIAIAAVIAILAQGKPAPYKPLWYGFAAFIVACGFSHFLHTLAIYYVWAFVPEAIETDFTAIISTVVAGLLVWHYPDINETLKSCEERKVQKLEEYQQIEKIQDETLRLAKETGIRANNAIAKQGSS